MTRHAELPMPRTPQSRSHGKVWVLFLIRVADGAEQRFVEVYDTIKNEVAKVPGHVLEQVCQSTDDTGQWLITSEWESAEHFLAWEQSNARRELVRPLWECLEQRHSLQFQVVRQT
jgi:heme-degrading monooxygenase HmoA